jgi:uncharacterized membrane protein
MAKSLSFGVLHLGIAFGISYALTGNLAVSGAITVLEPAANTVMHYFHDRHWPAVERWWQSASAGRPATLDASKPGSRT